MSATGTREKLPIPSIAEIVRMRTTVKADDISPMGVRTLSAPQHESTVRSYHLLKFARVLMKRGVPSDVVDELVGLVEEAAEQKGSRDGRAAETGEAGERVGGAATSESENMR